MQFTTCLIAALAAVTPALAQIGDCQMADGGPGEEAGKAVFDFFLRDFVRPQAYDEVCPLGQDRKSDVLATLTAPHHPHTPTNHTTGHTCSPKLTRRSAELTGELPGKWCGRCDGAELRFLHDGAFDNRCFNADDVYDVMEDVKWSFDECGYNIKADAYLTLVYGSEGFTSDDCQNHCLADA